MAWPYIGEEGFESGTLGFFNSETDTAAKLSFPSYRTLAADPRLKAAPYRGAYCMMVDLAKTPGTDAYVQEDDHFDISADGTLSCGFWLYVSDDITMANNDEFHLLVLQSSGPTTEFSCALKFTTAAGLQIGVGEGGFSSGTSISKGKWHHVALDFTVDDGGSNDGTVTLYLDGASVATVGSLDQGAIIQARFGATGLDSGTTKGVLLFDDLIVDDTRVYPRKDRWSTSQHITKTGHVFVGPGWFEAQLIDGGSADCTLKVYDTDRADTNNHAGVEYMEADQANQTIASSAPIQVSKGCYVVLAGTSPEAIIRVRRAVAWGSDGAVRQYGRRIG